MPQPHSRTAHTSFARDMNQSPTVTRAIMQSHSHTGPPLYVTMTYLYVTMTLPHVIMTYLPTTCVCVCLYVCVYVCVCMCVCGACACVSVCVYMCVCILYSYSI